LVQDKATEEPCKVKSINCKFRNTWKLYDEFAPLCTNLVSEDNITQHIDSSAALMSLLGGITQERTISFTPIDNIAIT
jgi:hypothetical protein